MGEASPEADEPALRENMPGLGPLTPELAAKAQACLFLSAGLVGALGVFLPHPGGFNEQGMLAVQISSVAVGALLFAFHQKVPDWFTQAGPYGAATGTSVVLLSAAALPAPICSSTCGSPSTPSTS